MAFVSGVVLCVGRKHTRSLIIRESCLFRETRRVALWWVWGFRCLVSHMKFIQVWPSASSPDWDRNRRMSDCEMEARKIHFSSFSHRPTSCRKWKSEKKWRTITQNSFGHTFITRSLITHFSFATKSIVNDLMKGWYVLMHYTFIALYVHAEAREWGKCVECSSFIVYCYETRHSSRNKHRTVAGEGDVNNWKLRASSAGNYLHRIFLGSSFFENHQIRYSVLWALSTWQRQNEW